MNLPGTPDKILHVTTFLQFENWYTKAEIIML